MQRFEFQSDADGHTIAAYRWDAATPPRAVVQIAHGLAEHAQRYSRFAAELVSRGYTVYANDHRGHGGSMSGVAGDFGAGGWNALVADVGQLNRIARAAHPDVPLVLFGHSLGSFATQFFLLDHSAEVDAAALSGSSDLVALAQLAASGADVSFSAFNAAFEPARTPFDWLSRDAAEVDAYIADPLCGFDAPATSGQSLMMAAPRLGEPGALASIRRDLPLLILSGDRDPVSGAGALFHSLVARYREAGLTRVRDILYADGRHEMLNETNRAAVTADILDWLDGALTRRH